MAVMYSGDVINHAAVTSAEWTQSAHSSQSDDYTHKTRKAKKLNTKLFATVKTERLTRWRA